jgi:hypothetical protein
MICSLSRLNRTRATCPSAAMAEPCCGLTPRTEWHQDGTADRPNTRAAYPSSGAYTTKPRRLPFDIFWRKRTPSYRACWVNLHM